jgi:hypothetical protein
LEELLPPSINVPIWVIGLADNRVPLSQRVPFKVVASIQMKLLAMIDAPIF